MWVSTGTIYQPLYLQSRGARRRDLAKCLRTGRRLANPTARERTVRAGYCLT